MFPVLFRIGDFEVTSFGALVAIAALVGLWIFRRELVRSGLPESAADAGLAGVFGGVAGAKLLWVFEHLDEAPFFDLLLSRGGMSWFGGFAGGLVAGMLVMYVRRLPVIRVLSAAAPALAIGHAIGRVGCLLVGDDYGTPTDLPWGIAFPEGLPPTTVPVHPTMMYEAIALVPFAWVLIRMRRAGTTDAVVLGTYLAGAGVIRFVIEFLRVNERVVGPLSVAHVASLIAVAIGAALLFHRRARPR
jgi:phosphatidylglycerol:prolipoprotein diacylglycerol transferase